MEFGTRELYIKTSEWEGYDFGCDLESGLFYCVCNCEHRRTIRSVGLNVVDVCVIFHVFLDCSTKLPLISLDPTIHHVVLDRSLTSVIFANDSPCIITGDENGSVDVYMLKNIPFKMEKPREQEAEVLASVLDTANKGISVAA